MVAFSDCHCDSLHVCSYLVSSAVKSPFAISKTIGLIFLLLSAGLLEPVIVRTVKFRLQKVLLLFVGRVRTYYYAIISAVSRHA